MAAIDAALTEARTQLGREIGVSPWITVDQPMIDAFAQVTRDDQWIHTDPERATAQAPFGGTIAHGFLTLSLASRFAYDCLPETPGQVMGINYGFNRVRFLSPVPAGARLRGRFVLDKVRRCGDAELLREYGLTVDIEDRPTPALQAQWLGLAVFDPGPAPRMPPPAGPGELDISR